MNRRVGCKSNKLSIGIWLCAFATSVTTVKTSLATVPNNPLPTPLFSFDPQSFQVTGMPNFKPADILEEGPLVGPALVFVPAVNLGLGANGDALNGLSFANSGWDPSTPFSLLFSLDRASTGLAPPDPQLFGNCVPFNATDQCMRGTQAGDMYMSTQSYSLVGAFVRSSNRAALSLNSVLVVNNYDEGGTDHKAMPAGPASSTASANRAAVVGIMDDNVSSSAYQNGPMPPSMPVQRIYFTVLPGSPSLTLLSAPLSPSGAHIFFNQNPGMAPTTLFASAAALNLQLGDELDAIHVFDFNNDGVFNAGDQVLFSLSPDSPSLGAILGASPVGAAADVFRKPFGSPIQVFATAVEFGLGSPTDNIDSLEILPCADPYNCALDHGIRGDSVVGGCPTVSTWGLTCFTLLLATTGTLVIRRKYALPRAVA